MAPNLSLRVRLSILFGVVLAAGLLIGVALLILNAGARVRAEDDGSTRLARELVVTAFARLENAPDPSSSLTQMLGDVESLRHVRIFVEGQAITNHQPAGMRRAPDWFTALVLPHPSVTRIELDGRAGLHGTLVVASQPADEIAEIWDDVLSLALGGAGIALVAFALVSMAVSKTLRPVSALADGLARLERGDRSVRIAPGGPPEFVIIADRINALASTLERFDEENHHLVQRIIHVQHDERRDIARDLHDEICPFLFSIRAGIGALARKAEAPAPQGTALAEECRRIDEQLTTLQQVNRRILGRLRPAALEEMNLSDALEALAVSWRESHPQVEIDLLASDAAVDIDESIALTAYRIGQEGLTNVIRHSGATYASVFVTQQPRGSRKELRIEVRDNGVGLGPNAKEGIGLRGMSERVAALGSRLIVAAALPSGTRLEAYLPLDGKNA